MRHFLRLAGAIGILASGMGPGASGRALILGPRAPDGLAPGLLTAPVEAVSIPAVALAADPHQQATTGT